jgi:hypothetical protein
MIEIGKTRRSWLSIAVIVVYYLSLILLVVCAAFFKTTWRDNGSYGALDCVVRESMVIFSLAIPAIIVTAIKRIVAGNGVHGKSSWWLDPAIICLFVIVGIIVYSLRV